jgi:hypothetical protein
MTSGSKTPLNAALPLLFVVALAAGSCTKKEEADPTFAGGKNINVVLVADQSPACVRGDLLSLQLGSTLGTTVGVDIMLTDCDASMLVTGVNFKVTYDDTVLDFVGCTKGSFFPSTKLAPGAPDCSASGGVVRGVIALQLPNSVRVAGGAQDVLRLTFSASQGGISSHSAFTGADSLSGTAVYLADTATQTATVYPLGGTGYAGGTFTSN